MNSYVVTDKYGVAVINTDSPEEAFGLLKKKRAKKNIFAIKRPKTI